MTYKYITTLALLSSLIAPSVVFAEPNKNIEKENKGSQIYRDVNEAEKNKNRMERINNALNTMDGNINIVEKAIKQTSLRMEIVDPKKKDVSIIKTEIENATAKLTEAKNVIAAAKEYAKTMDSTNGDNVQNMRNRINESRKLTRESINLTKSVIHRLKDMKIIPATSGVKVIENK